MGDYANLVMQIAGMVLAAGAVYGGIRAEQRAMMRDIARLERSVDKAHSRLDKMGCGRRGD